MRKQLTHIPTLLTRAMLALFAALLVCALYLGAGRDGETQKALLLALPLLAVLAAALPPLSRLLAKLV